MFWLRFHNPDGGQNRPLTKRQNDLEPGVRLSNFTTGVYPDQWFKHMDTTWASEYDIKYTELCFMCWLSTERVFIDAQVNIFN